MIKSKEPVASLRFTLKTLFSNKRFMINSVCLAYSMIAINIMPC